jgi:glycine/D-amino acid oxidase-like deaminating enzyme
MTQDAHWGEPLWKIDFHPQALDAPEAAAFVVVGGGFSGLAAAAWLGRMAPRKKVVLLEAETIGAGASGRSGVLALAETAAGNLPGLGDVLKGYAEIVAELGIDCDLELPGAWEIGRSRGRSDSPISWNDSGTLRVVNEVPGGTINPGKMVAGLARAAEAAGVILCEHSPVQDVSGRDILVVKARNREVRAGCVLLATNAASLELGNLQGTVEPKLTLALATEPLGNAEIEALGLSSGKPFYTVDYPYLWGRRTRSNQLVFGAGLVDSASDGDLAAVNVNEGIAAERLSWLERRVHELHPVLRDVKIAHRWGGPILFTDGMKPLFRRRSQSERVFLLAGYNGHGVALSVYLGKWAAEAMLGMRSLPDWGAVS